MKPERLYTIIIGICLIAATVFGVASVIVTGPVLSSPDYLLNIFANPTPVTTGSFLVLLMAISCAGVGLAMYPIIRKFSAFLAIAIAGFRVIEAGLQTITAAGQVSLLPLSQAAAKAGSTDLAYYQGAANAIRAGSDWLNNGAMLIFWCIAALMYYSIFYQYRLVPRWLSAWGLIGILLTLSSSVLLMLNAFPASGDFQMMINLPIFLQELVFATWLIVRGLNPIKRVQKEEVIKLELSPGEA